MAKESKPDQGLTLAEANKDRYPELTKVLSAVSREVAKDAPYVVKVEVYTLASGEGSYRYWKPGDDEPTVGYFAPGFA